MKKITIDNESILGYGYCTNCENDENGRLYVPKPERPDYTGTLEQVKNSMDNDGCLQDLLSGNQTWTSAWFVKIGKIWFRIIDNDEYDINLFVDGYDEEADVGVKKI